jgi:outer membrane protein
MRFLKESFMTAFSFLLLFLSLCVQAQDALLIKAKDIKGIIETRNEKVTAKGYQVSAMEYRQGFLKRSFLPNVKVYGAQERFELGNSFRRTQPTYGAEVSVNIFNGMRDSLYDDVLEKRKERLETEKRVTVYEEIIKAKEIYWNLVYLENVLLVLSEVQDINSKNLKSAKSRIRAGITTSADRYEFEIKETEVKRGIDQVNIKRKTLERELIALLGYPEGSLIKLADKFEHLESMASVDSHTEFQHQFLAKPSLLQAEENQLEAKMQSRSWWPKLDAYAAQNQYNVRSGNIFDQQEGKETVLGVRLSMNLFDFTSGNQEASALRQEAQGSRAEAKYLFKQIENEAHSEIETLDFLHKQLHDAEANIERANGYFKITMEEYKRGVKNSPDVLGSVDQLYEIKAKYFEILRDFYITHDHLKTKGEI